MPYYATFDGCLHSDQLLFPELAFSDSRTPSWHLEVVREPSELVEDGETLGAGLEPYCEITLCRIPNGLRLRHSCTGYFDITSNGRNIAWHPTPTASLEMGRIDVLGRVLSVALHLNGVIALHGSAVGFDGSAIAFLAPKLHGKSTLAAALVRAGARLLSDDTVAVRLSPSATVHYGVPSMRLCSDSAQRFIAPETPQRVGVDGKHVVDHKRDEVVTAVHTPLSAIYLLQPVVRGIKADSARRTRLPVTQAAIALLGHAKIASLLGKTEATVVFERAATLARAVPVYRLEVVRDFDEIEVVLNTIMSWHDSTEMPALVGV